MDVEEIFGDRILVGPIGMVDVKRCHGGFNASTVLVEVKQ